MCYAILRIKYKNDNKRETVDIDLQENLDKRVQDQLNKSEVSRVEVFVCGQIHTKKETVEVSVYRAPDKPARDIPNGMPERDKMVTV